MSKSLAVFYEHLDNDRERFFAGFRERTPLVQLCFPNYMHRMRSEHGRDVNQMPRPAAFDRRISHLGERMQIQRHRKRLPGRVDRCFQLGKNIEIS